MPIYTRCNHFNYYPVTIRWDITIFLYSLDGPSHAHIQAVECLKLMKGEKRVANKVTQEAAEHWQ